MDKKTSIFLEDSDEDSLFYSSSSPRVKTHEEVAEEDDIPHGEVDYLHDVPIGMSAQVGSVQKTMREILSMKPGSVVEFEKVVGEPMDVIIGGRLMCRGEIVVVNERYGIRISEVIRAEDSEKALKKI